MGSPGFNEQIKMKKSTSEALWEAKRYWKQRTKRTIHTNAFDQTIAELKVFYKTDLGER